jgi:hypothetical protein
VITTTAVCQESPLDFTLHHQLSTFQDKEYFTVTIRLQNSSSDSIYYWVQNWKVTGATSNGQNVFIDEPIGKGAVSNTLFFFDNRIEKSKTYSNITDNYYSDFVPKCDLLKPIPPQGMFVINLVIQDSSIIDLVKRTPADQLYVKYYYSFGAAVYKDSFLEELGNTSELDIFYDSDLLTILFSPPPDDGGIECPCNLLNSLCATSSITKHKLGLIASQLTQARMLFILE